MRAAHVGAARAIFDAHPHSSLRDLFASCVFQGAVDVDAGVRSAAAGATRVFFRRFLPEKHAAIFRTVLAKLPPVVVVDEEVEVEDGDGEGLVMLASEQAFAKLSDGGSDNGRRRVLYGGGGRVFGSELPGGRKEEGRRGCYCLRS